MKTNFSVVTFIKFLFPFFVPAHLSSISCTVLLPENCCFGHFVEGPYLKYTKLHSDVNSHLKIITVIWQSTQPYQRYGRYSDKNRATQSLHAKTDGTQIQLGVYQSNIEHVWVFLDYADSKHVILGRQDRLCCS